MPNISEYSKDPKTGLLIHKDTPADGLNYNTFSKTHQGKHLARRAEQYNELKEKHAAKKKQSRFDKLMAKYKKKYSKGAGN